jgi:hypothetical protein
MVFLKLTKGHGRCISKDGRKVYDGMWEEDVPSGYGTLSSGGIKLYSGNWKNGSKHGKGVEYGVDFTYEGDWQHNEKRGWGKLHYSNGNRYEGEFDQVPHGQGTMRYGSIGFILVNGNRYEGMWVKGEKEGPGKFYYRDKKVIFTGEWNGGIAKCGVLEGDERTPEIGLKEWENVVKIETEKIIVGRTQ